MYLELKLKLKTGPWNLNFSSFKHKYIELFRVFLSLKFIQIQLNTWIFWVKLEKNSKYLTQVLLEIIVKFFNFQAFLIFNPLKSVHTQLDSNFWVWTQTWTRLNSNFWVWTQKLNSTRSFKLKTPYYLEEFIWSWADGLVVSFSLWMQLTWVLFTLYKETVVPRILWA